MTNGVTIIPDGQSLVITALGSNVFYTDTALSTAVTLPARISSTTTWYCSPADAGSNTFTIKQQDGSTLWNAEPVFVGTTNDTQLRPRPTLAQLAAATGVRTPFGYKTGEYYYASNIVTTQASGISKDRLYLSPYLVESTLSIARLGCAVTTGGSAGAVIRLGIYADNGSGYPGDLVLDAGAGIDGTSATVQEITLGTAQVLTPGVYWFGGVCQVNSGVSARSPVYGGMGFPLSFGTTAPTTSQEVYAYAQTGVTGALPSTFSTTTVTSTVGIRTHFKVS